MPKLASVLLVPAATAALAGCGGGRRSPAAGVASCLNGERGFLVQSDRMSVSGQTPSGVTFSLRLYGTDAAARTAASPRSPKSTAVVGDAVVDFGGQPGAARGRAAGEDREA
ncbi:MAG: hypothetical protein ACRDLK_09795 [Gaiellaceae bacterium]